MDAFFCIDVCRVFLYSHVRFNLWGSHIMLRCVRSFLFVVLAAVTFISSTAKAADLAEGGQSLVTSKGLLFEAVGDLLFPGVELRFGIVMLRYDMFRTEEVIATNGFSLTTSLVKGKKGKKGAKMTFGLANRFMFDSEDIFVQVYPEIGYVYWGDALRVKLGFGVGGEFSRARSGNDWGATWLILGLFGITG